MNEGQWTILRCLYLPLDTNDISWPFHTKIEHPESLRYSKHKSLTKTTLTYTLLRVHGPVWRVFRDILEQNFIHIWPLKLVMLFHFDTRTDHCFNWTVWFILSVSIRHYRFKYWNSFLCVLPCLLGS